MKKYRFNIIPIGIKTLELKTSFQAKIRILDLAIMEFLHKYTKLSYQLRKQVIDFVDFLLSKNQSIEVGNAKNKYPLRGSVIRFESPVDPVADNDWEVLN